MAEPISAPKGTYDVLPEQQPLRRWILACAERVFQRYAYRRIDTPTVEETRLFTRGVGEATDIVRKEMYTFEDLGGRSMTLRPEGTAPVARAYVEHGMHTLPQPVKLYYHSPMFRYESPQSGRYPPQQERYCRPPRQIRRARTRFVKKPALPATRQPVPRRPLCCDSSA
jgi:histidyl-tRNA synthetase